MHIFWKTHIVYICSSSYCLFVFIQLTVPIFITIPKNALLKKSEFLKEFLKMLKNFGIVNKL